MDGIAASYVAETLEDPPVPFCLSSATVYAFAVHLAYNVVAAVLFHFLALAPDDV